MTLSRLEIDDERWAAFAAGRPEATPFHDPRWAQLLHECYGYPAFALALDGPDGTIAAGVPVLDVKTPFGRRRWVSLPYTDECEPLGGGTELGVALEAARQEAGVDRVELRGPLEGAAAGEVGFEHVLELQLDAQEVFRGFKRKQVAQPIEKTEREGLLTVRRGERREDLTEIFYGLHLETRRRLGVPVQPRRYFQLLWDRLLGSGDGFVLVAEAGGQPAAAAVFLAWNRRIVYKYSASKPESLKLRPNNMLLWNAIRWGCEHGFVSLDFGRTDAGNEGLRSFKRGWGGEERPLVYSTLGGAAPEGGTGVATRALGAVIRRSPRFICRGLGELLYKYAA